MVSPLSTILKMCLRTRPEVPAQIPYSSRTVSAQVRHSTYTGHTSQSLAAARICRIGIIGWSSLPK